MDVEIISVERIKPSFPTPNHLKTYKLCVLDHLIPAAFSPVVLFYHNHDSISHFRVLERLDQLKNSLSEVLTQFYPLAGTIRGDFCIDCDDQGACFTSAKVNCCLSEFLAVPDLKLLSSFLPCGLNSNESCVTNIQASVFTCGGVAIGVCISHRIFDGTALSNFLRSWAINVSSSNDKIVSISPDFDTASLFRGDGSRLKDASLAMWSVLFKKSEFVTKRFVFDGSAIASLKDMVVGLNATRVETISAFIWKCAMDVFEERCGFKKPSMLTHVVNLRRRVDPNMSERSVGNLIWLASAKCMVGKERVVYPLLVDEVRKSLNKIDGGYVEKLMRDDGESAMVEWLKEIEGFGCEDVSCLGFTSWCKLGLYDVNFGWGKPVWVSSVDLSGSFFMNLVVLVDTRCGNGIEAWVTLDEQDMAILEHHQEFTTFASFNPSISVDGKSTFV